SRRHLQPGLAGELLDRVDEGQPAAIHQPADRVAMGGAPVAMIEALVVDDREARRLLRVERAKRLVLAPRLFQLQRAPDQPRERGSGAQLVEEGDGDAHTKSPSLER